MKTLWKKVRRTLAMVAVFAAMVVGFAWYTTPSGMNDTQFVEYNLARLSLNIFPLSGEMQTLARDLERRSLDVARTGQSDFTLYLKEESTLIFSPPYMRLAILADVASLDAGQVAWMQAQVNESETGHLFLVRKGRVVDHQTLGPLIDPRPIVATSKTFHVRLGITRQVGRMVDLFVEAK